MSVTVNSFAKINLGLRIGPARPDGFHELRTVYQTIALHDTVRVQVARGSGIQIRCENPRVPTNQTNTCHRIIERAMAALKASGRVIIEIEKRLPVQGGLGGASSNAVAALLALERALKKQLSGADKLLLAAEVGSDVPLFFVGGTVLGVGRGEEVYPLPDLRPAFCVLAAPEMGVSTPQAFADWDSFISGGESGLRLAQADSFGSAQDRLQSAPIQPSQTGEKGRPSNPHPKLTLSGNSDRMNGFGRSVASWLSGCASGVPARGRGRAETPLLDLVRTGIENDFEKVVFPKYPELREVKRVLELSGAPYASLSGSGSAVYGLFRSRVAAQKAAAKLRKSGTPAQATATLTREQYWKKVFDC